VPAWLCLLRGSTCAKATPRAAARSAHLDWKATKRVVLEQDHLGLNRDFPDASVIWCVFRWIVNTDPG